MEFEIIMEDSVTDVMNGRKYLIEIIVLRLSPEALREYTLAHYEPKREDFEDGREYMTALNESLKKQQAFDRSVAEKLHYDDVAGKRSFSLTQNVAEFFTAVVMSEMGLVSHG